MVESPYRKESEGRYDDEIRALLDTEDAASRAPGAFGRRASALLFRATRPSRWSKRLTYVQRQRNLGLPSHALRSLAAPLRAMAG